MTTHQEKLGAYTNTSQQQSGNAEIDSRATDKAALLNCANRLNAALNDAGKDMKAYAEALRHNQRLWTIFQVALCDPDNPLPRELKITLLNLSRYVDRVSFRAVTEFSADILTSLIDINRIIAAGLAKKPATAQPPAATVPPQALAPPTSVMTSA